MESAPSRTIKPINKSVVHKICSGQVILDLPSAVKELVENSLDAGATSVEIALKEYGQESFKVVDNGCGISSNDFEFLALKHHTSKIADFTDLQSLSTFGFRGEALSSLAALGNLTIETRTKDDTVGTHLTFSHSGLVASQKKTARQVGTTVTVEKLFSTLPVRNKEFSRNIRREYGKLITLLNAYAIIAGGVRLVCSNTSGKSSKSVVLKTQGSLSIRDNIITVFGTNTFSCLEPLNLNISDECKVDGFISKPGNGSGRSSGDRQFFYVNGRPVDMPKVGKLVNEIYRCANSKQYPIAIMNFILSAKSYDVNVTPDKRKIFLSQEGNFMSVLKDALESVYSSGQCIYSVSQLEDISREDLSKKPFDLMADEHGNIIPPSTSSQFNCEHNGSTTVEHSHPEMVCLDDEEKLKSTFDVTSVKSRDQEDKVSTVLQNSRVGEESASRTNECPLLNTHAVLQGCSTSLTNKNRRLQASLRNSQQHLKIVQSSLAKFLSVNKRKPDNEYAVLSESPLLRNYASPCQMRKISSGEKVGIPMSIVCQDDKEINVDESVGDLETETHLSNILDESASPNDCNPHDQFQKTSVDDCKPLNNSQREISHSEERASVDDCKPLNNSQREISHSEERVDAGSIKSSEKFVQSHAFNVTFDTPKSRSEVDKSYSLHFDLKDLRKRREQKQSRMQLIGSTTLEECKGKRSYMAATLDTSQLEDEKAGALSAATNELERIFEKKDFACMKVVGQFNLGFIIAKVNADLFIVDQHAADEKYNFERLSTSTILNQQPLLQPMPLGLSPEEEVVASLHMDVIRKNGFSLIEDPVAVPGQRLLLKAVPFSQNMTFGAEDVRELISTLADSQGECSILGSYRIDDPSSICPSRVRNMLASRACRTSIMIGDPLDRNEMQTVLRHLAGLRSPWNCPHGRPTMRHLINLASLLKSESEC